ncbi:recombinase family protein [Streptomyces atratus]|uniref:Resolvase, N terminal domain n=1 Tax=Streptomyces atratus TaxID=1893 RepID=A0A1K2F894_STRAR|nr:recombinase family protein [Streptomyces atratus]SFY43754.1 Resolvase, N terminal domain [Streptomyces atratus]
MLLGYCRTSTADQNPDHQIDALLRNGVDRDNIHVDGASGAKASRPKLDLVMQLMREGDTLKVTRLDRLSRSVLHLVTLGADLRERGIGLHVIEQGIDTTTPPKLTPDQAELTQQLYGAREKTVQQIADMLNVPRFTVYGHLDRDKTVPRQPKKTAAAKP